jgi:hypothetical protein
VWIEKHRQASIEQSVLAPAPTDGSAEKANKQALIALVEALKQENQRLRNKVVSLMMKAGEL